MNHQTKKRHGVRPCVLEAKLEERLTLSSTALTPAPVPAPTVSTVLVGHHHHARPAVAHSRAAHARHMRVATHALHNGSAVAVNTNIATQPSNPAPPPTLGPGVIHTPLGTVNLQGGYLTSGLKTNIATQSSNPVPAPPPSLGPGVIHSPLGTINLSGGYLTR
jgi:hypothetical protein